MQTLRLLTTLFFTGLFLLPTDTVAQQPEVTDVPPPTFVMADPANATISGSESGDVSLVELNFDILLIPVSADVTSAVLTYVQEGTSNGVLRFVDKQSSDILDAKALSSAGPKQIQNFYETFTDWLYGDIPGIIMQASDLETDAQVTISNITLELEYTIPDSEAPEFIQTEVFEITDSSAKIFWELSEPAEVTIDYGKTSNYTRQKTVNSDLLFKDFKLTNLSPGLTYHFKLTATDAAGNKTSTRNNTFTTSLAGEQVLGAERTTVSKEVLQPPSIKSLEINPEDAIRTIHVSWVNLSETAIDGYVLYRSSDEGASYKEIKRVGAETLKLEDTGISPNTTYYYAIRSIKGDTQSELSDPLAVYVPEVIADQIRISSEETVDAIGRTTLVIVAAAGLIIITSLLLIRKLAGLRSSSEPMSKKSYTRNVLRDPEYYSEEF